MQLEHSSRNQGGGSPALKLGGGFMAGVTYPGGSGIESLRQILLANRFAISTWQGTASA